MGKKPQSLAELEDISGKKIQPFQNPEVATTKRCCETQKSCHVDLETQNNPQHPDIVFDSVVGKMLFVDLCPIKYFNLTDWLRGAAF